MSDNEDWGKEYSKLADLYAKKCKEVRELKDKNKQIRAEVIEEFANRCEKEAWEDKKGIRWVSLVEIHYITRQLKEQNK